MKRRSFLQGFALFLAAGATVGAAAGVALSTPQLEVPKPLIDWGEWNEVRFKYAGGNLRAVTVNDIDYTNDPQARRQLSEYVRVVEDGVEFGAAGYSGLKITLPVEMPIEGAVTFMVKDTQGLKATDPPGVYLDNLCVIDTGSQRDDSWMH